MPLQIFRFNDKCQLFFCRQLNQVVEEELLGRSLGYYTPIDSKGAIFETYAGYGRGNVFGNNSFLDDKTNVWFDRFFIQPNIGIRSKYFEIGACIRFAAVNIHKTFPDKLSSGYNYFIEPTASLRLGWQWVKFDLQFGFSGILKKMIWTYTLIILL